jgi:hypothetical protein
MHAFSPKNALFCTFLQGGGTTFWQGVFGGFRGLGASRAGHFLCHVFRLRKTPNPIEPCSISKIVLLHLRNILLTIEKLWNNINNFGGISVFHTHQPPKGVEVRVTTFGASRNAGGLLLILLFHISQIVLGFCLVPRSVNSRTAIMIEKNEAREAFHARWHRLSTMLVLIVPIRPKSSFSSSRT